MMYYTHQATSTVLGYALMQSLNITNPYAYFGTILVASTLPDADHPNSYINRYNPFRKLTSKLKHRGIISHSPIGLIIILIPCFFFFPTYTNFLKGLIVGYMGHLAGDYFTKQGLPSRNSRKRTKSPLTFTTNSITEKVIFVLSLLYLFLFSDFLKIFFF